jgi:hypothetical protein
MSTPPLRHLRAVQHGGAARLRTNTVLQAGVGKTAAAGLMCVEETTVYSLNFGCQTRQTVMLSDDLLVCMALASMITDGF